MAWMAAAAGEIPASRLATAPRGEAVPLEVIRFLQEARALDLQPVALRLGQAQASSRPWQKVQTYRVWWWEPWELRLWGRCLLSLRLPHTGVLDKYAPEQVIMPVWEERLALQLKPLPMVEEMAVLVEREVDPILAVRVAGRWFGAHRWLRRPYILSPDEAAAHLSCPEPRPTPHVTLTRL